MTGVQQVPNRRPVTEETITSKAILERADSYQSIFQNSALGIFQSTLAGRFLRVNAAMARMFGYESPEEMIRLVDDIAHQIYLRPDFRQKVLAAVQAEDGLARFEGEFLRKNGSILVGSLNIRAIRDDNGRISHLDGFVEDVTEARRQEAAIRQEAEYLARENLRLRSSIQDRYRFRDIVGKSPVMQEVYQTILQAAATDVGVIIYGESGTGKELVARAIHDLSDRRNGEFVPVNCGAIPEQLLEREFFGHKKGAFSGASADTHGYLDLANDGTLFLDEIGELGLEMQVKLLRALEGGGYTPVGDNKVHYSQFRLVAATNRNLREMAKTGQMREDFFFRVHIIPITMPALRERREDIPLLIDYYLSRFSAPESKPVLPGQVLEALYNYEWPGNVRELQNVLRRYLATKRLDFLSLTGSPPSKDRSVMAAQAARTGQTLAEMVAGFEKEVIGQTLAANRWHRGKTAAALGIDRKTLFVKMKAFGM